MSEAFKTFGEASKYCEKYGLKVSGLDVRDSPFKIAEALQKAKAEGYENATCPKRKEVATCPKCGNQNMFSDSTGSDEPIWSCNCGFCEEGNDKILWEESKRE